MRTRCLPSPAASRALAIAALSLGSWWAAAKPVPRYVSVPFTPKAVMTGDAATDPFVSCPVYELTSPQQTIQRENYEGENDFTACARFLWSEKALYLRLDVRDNAFRPLTNAAPNSLDGDYFLLRFVHETAGAEAKAEPFQLVLAPDPTQGTCAVTVEAGEISKARIGQPQARLLKGKANEYAIILEVPTDAWQDPPRKNRLLRFQIISGDADTEPRPQHVFAAFPPTDTTPLQRATGAMHFVETFWVKLMPARAKFDDSTAVLLLEYGNFDRDAEALGLTVLDPAGKVVKEVKDAALLEAGKQLQDVPIRLDLAGLPKGVSYQVRFKAGVYHDPTTVTLERDPAEAGAVFCPDLIEHRLTADRRPLRACREPARVRETIRQLAGGGTVLWSAGGYDASSAEFPEVLRASGPYTLTIPSRTPLDADVPWALFGGADHLDKMNEPLVLKLDAAALKGASRLAPDHPDSYPHLALHPQYKRTASAARLLFLLGVVTYHLSPEQYPVITIADQDGRRLLTRRLRPSDFERPSRHAYVLRLWLDGSEKELRIENASAEGPRVELDFLALVGGGPELSFPADQSSLEFGGTDEARQFNKMLASSLYFARYYLVDDTGVGHASLPGGRYTRFNLHDHALLLSELSHWGCLDQSRLLLSNLPRLHQWLGEDEAKEMSVGFPMLVSAVYSAWRAGGEDNALLRTAWRPIVAPTLSDLRENAEANSMGLISGGGDLGSPRLEGGSTIPLVAAARAAFLGGAAMAAVVESAEQAAVWRQAAGEMDRAAAQYLHARAGGQGLNSATVFPAAYGLAEVRGIRTSLDEGTLIYGQTANKTPLLYNGDTRVFDSPYVFAGLPLAFDYSGFELTEKESTQLLRTRTLMVKTNPLLQAGQACQRYGLYDYKTAATHLWLTMGATALEDQELTGSLLGALVRYNFNEYLDLPPLADIALSPYLFKERLRVDAKGDNPGGTGDEGNAAISLYALRAARLLAGLDDSDATQLKLLPRLPRNWPTVVAKNWLVRHDFADSKTERVTFGYERLRTNGYNLSFTSPQPVKKLMIRVGPFGNNVQLVQVTVNGKPTTVRPVRLGMPKWVVLNLEDIGTLNVSAVPTGG